MTMAPQLIAEQFQKLGRTRHPSLFTKFLPLGYSFVELSSVAAEHQLQARQAKLILGSFITLIDDLADDPIYRDACTLKQIYSFQFVTSQEASKPTIVDANTSLGFALALQRKFCESLKGLPHYESYKSLLDLELTQVFLANQMSEAQQDYQAITLTESRYTGPYNMGMTAAGIIDLMATNKLVSKVELPMAREIFQLGQRHGRISNLISTYEREMESGDRTNEIAIASRLGFESGTYRANLQAELRTLQNSILLLTGKIQTFDVGAYARGLIELHSLHLHMVGTI